MKQPHLPQRTVMDNCCTCVSVRSCVSQPCVPPCVACREALHHTEQRDAQMKQLLCQFCP
jgi:hypothetical protein